MSDFDIIQDKLEEKTSKTVSRDEFEELKKVVYDLIEKIKTRNF